MTPLDDTQLRKAAPSIFASEPWGEVSERYAFIPTISVVDALRGEGFFPVKATQSKSRIEGKAEFTKHMIRFRRDDGVAIHSVGDEMPELVLVNSHDRTSSYQLSAGIFRLVCSNGMIVKSANFGDIKVQHSGDIAGQVIEGSYTIISEMPKLMSRMDELKGVQLTPQEQFIFAKSALQLRYPDDSAGNSTSPIRPEALLSARRRADAGMDLWTTFNRVQENMIKGGVHGTGSTGRRMSTRKVNSVSEDIRLNKALWLLTENMAALKH